MKNKKNIIVPTLFLMMFGLILTNAAIAQNGSEGKSLQKKKVSAKEEKRAEKEREKKIKKGYDPKKNAAAQKGETVVRPMEFHGESEPLSELVKRKPVPLGKNDGKLQESDKEPILDDRTEPPNDDAPASEVQTNTDAPSAASLMTSFESLGTGLAGFTLTGAPPDTTLAVGPNHIVAWVNSQYAVFNKAGTVLLGPVNGNTLFTGLGNVCETTNRGDPILQYDRLAQRWFLSQFAFSVSGGNPIAPYLQCIAVSTTNDPTGTYYRYTISFGSTSPNGFNDYGKLGVWNDAYYTSYNIFGGSPAGGNTGVSLCASDRTKMLAGDPTATTLCAPTAFYASGASFLPADLDGTDLPTDTTRGGVFVRYGNNSLRMVRLKPDFAGSTVTLTDGYGGASGSFVTFSVGGTTLPCNGTGGTCVDQPNTTTNLDTLGDRLMYRLAYRNRGGVDSLVVTHSVDPDGAGARSSAIRWYEIRNPLNNPADTNTGLRPFVYQNATFDPGASGDRWMGSMTTNKFGDIMLGYSYVNAGANISPSIVVAGRGQQDTINQLQTELTAVTGAGSQTGGLTRWGDYSTMQVDPSDESTFWFTTQYLSANGSFNWRTRVVSYKFPTTTATGGDFNVPASWSNGVPNSLTSGIIPNGVTVTINNPTTIGNLIIETGGNLVMNANLDVNGSLTLGTTIDTGANTLGLGCEATVSGASAANYVIGNIRKDYCRTQAFTYPTGTANGYSPANVNITALATNPSSLEIRAVQGNRLGMNPLESAQRYWTLNETGDLTANLVFNYLQSDVVGTEANYNLYRFVGLTASAVTPFTLNTTANTISTNGISTFSDWTIGNLIPLAASVSVSGRIRTKGQTIPQAVVRLTDEQGNVFTTRTSLSGEFQFNDVPAGQTYTITATARRVQFTPQVLSISDNITGLILYAVE